MLESKTLHRLNFRIHPFSTNSTENGPQKETDVQLAVVKLWCRLIVPDVLRAVNVVVTASRGGEPATEKNGSGREKQRLFERYCVNKYTRLNAKEGRRQSAEADYVFHDLMVSARPIALLHFYLSHLCGSLASK